MITWMELLFPPVNLWSSPRKESMNDGWYYRAITEIEKEFDDGLLTEKEFSQAMRDLNAEYDEVMDRGKDDNY